MQTGSRRQPDEGCSTHVRPMSRVVQTARPVRRLSRMLSIRTPGATSATCDSVVLLRAWPCVCHVLPWSRLYITPAFGTRVESIYWIGKTSVPSRIVMPRPGPCNVKYQCGCLICRVRFRGADQLRPSSRLLASISCAVSIGSYP